MTEIAVLGTGAVGSAVARVLLDHDHRVTVWNRTEARTRPLLALGAEPAADLARLPDAELLLLCLTDAAAAVEVLAALPPAGEHEATVVPLLTAAPDEVARLAAAASAGGRAFLAAGVQTQPEDIGTAAASFLYAGDPAVFARHKAVLEALGGARWVGASPRAAAVWDQALFGLWYDAQLGLLRALDGVRAAGGDVAEFGPAAVRQLEAAVAGAPGTVEEVRRGEAPRGPASLAEHLPLLRDLAAARASSPLGDGGLGPVADLVARLVAGGHADAGLSATVREV